MLRKILVIGFSVIASLCALPAAEASSPIHYDVSFHENGSAMYWISDYQFAQDVAVDAAGNVFIALVVGNSDSATGYRPAVLRCTPNGRVEGCWLQLVGQ